MRGRIITAWAAGGVSFGFLFPVMSVAVDSYFARPVSPALTDLIAGNPVHFIVALAPVVLGVTFAVIGVFHKKQLQVIEHLKVSEREQWLLADHDSLTGAGNRYKLTRDLQEDAVELVWAHQERFVLLADLDSFKAVNDRWGHDVGDLTLKTFSGLMTAALPDGARLYRLGGDEFVILFAPSTGRADVITFAERAGEAMKNPVDLGPCRICFGASFGIAVHSPDRETLSDDVLHRADLALYEAKKSTDTHFRFFRKEMSNSATILKKTEVELARALEENEFFLEFQPIHSAQCYGDVVGAEALVRWRHPQLDVVPPGAFIEIAEKTGQIVRIGDHVLLEACRSAANWPLDIELNVNVSVLQFRHGEFTRKVRDALKNSGLSPDRLVLEINETLLLDDIGQVRTAVADLQSMGVRIALDDFGTGFTSVNNLRGIPFDKLKLDRSLTASMRTSDRDLSIVRAIVGLCAALNIETTIEGVEAAGQLGVIKDLGIDNIQGFHFSRPLSPLALASYLLRSKDLSGRTAQEQYKPAALHRA